MADARRVHRSKFIHENAAAMSFEEMGRRLGMTRQGAQQATARALASARRAAIRYGLHDFVEWLNERDNEQRIEVHR